MVSTGATPDDAGQHGFAYRFDWRRSAACCAEVDVSKSAAQMIDGGFVRTA
jgi:hypothetical protein